jgi:glutamate racemase
MSRKNPIGIFDSGIGGLTVAKAIRSQLPDESLVYFGDTAHLPYGDKSRELIAHYALRITEFLLREKNCKAIVIACNTASAAAYETLRDIHKGSVPVINVIDPMIEEVIADDQVHRIGIIATKTTISSGVYQEKFSRRKPQLTYAALATPLLASMIEEGFFNDSISKAVLDEYLSDPSLSGIDGLVLACTHYPLIKKEIDEYYAGKVRIFDSAEVVAKKLKRILEAEKLVAEKRSGEDHFYVSDYTSSFEQATKIFFREKIKLERSDLWDWDK